MDRELKFRVWDNLYQYFADQPDGKGAGISLTGELVYAGDNSFEMYDCDKDPSLKKFDRPERFVVEQFTGLKDSNNKDIYEGDIVKALSSDNKYLSIVRWDDGDGRWAFQSLLSKSMSYCYNLTYGCSRWEIVGNIHENPELLDKSRN
jgi:uncharacterized phage protein (TIGR01671 family)